MKVCIAQIDTTVGDFEGNAARILSALERGRAAGAGLVLFPELATTGYPPMDLLERSAFVEANLRVLDSVTRATTGLAAVVGFAEPNAGRGKPLFNAAAVLADGRRVGVHRKALLPTYDVFDEGRYFEPGRVFAAIDGDFGDCRRMAVTVCEDIWNDKAVWARTPYHEDPVEGILASGAAPDLLVNISASPFHVGKIGMRLDLARRLASRHRMPVVYANLVGGNDGLVFDGESFAVGADGRVLKVGPAFREDVFVVDLDAAPREDGFVPQDEAGAIVDALCLGIRDFCGKLGFRRVVIGVSGGIDSAVVAALAVRALGPEAVIGVSMPSPFTSEGTRRDAAELARNLGIEFHEIPVQPVFDAYLGSLTGALGERPGGLTEENLQARIRGALLMAMSNRTGALVLNTGNKSELAVGYCTLYGDMVGGLAVIGDLSKAMVYDVARALNAGAPVIPPDVITRAPSAELRPDQKDEDSLPPYPVLDPIVRAYVEEGLDASAIAARGFDPATVAWVVRTIAANEYKRRQAPLALKVTSKAFGVGRRFPVVQRFREGV